MQRDFNSKDRSVSDQKGQATILIAMMMTTFILFFAFVVNTGMLVNAKINLQNAADLAAYAGASVQARQLDQIGHLNYEMRRHYKRFLFKYYILGSLAQDPFPRQRGDSTPYTFGPIPAGATAQELIDYDFKVPSVCIIYNSESNLCRNHERKTTIQKSFATQAKLGLFNATLYEQMKRLESINLNNCTSLGKLNVMILNNWLFNFDPEVNNLSATSSADQDTMNTIKQVIYGLGLIPRESITRKRIDTLAKYVNAEPQKLTRERVNTLKSSPSSAAKNERSIQAWMSAYLTLGENSFANIDKIELTEILPFGGQGGGANLIKLNDIKVGFDAYATQFSKGQCPPDPADWDDASNTGDGGFKDCKFCPTAVTMAQVPVGVYKDPSVLTYYALALKAQAKVLFSPFGDMTLKAYAAARPFGSRIGPPLSADGKDFIKRVQFDPFCNAVPGCVGQVPDLPIYDADGEGWYRTQVLHAFYWAMNPQPDTGDFLSQAITPEMIRNATHIATAPNPWEIGKYNIPHDLPDAAIDQFEKFYDSDSRYAIWAPLTMDTANNAELEQTVEDILDSYKALSPNIAGNATGMGDFESFKTSVRKDFRDYLNQMKAGRGENGESLNIARIQDPFRQLPTMGAQGNYIHVKPAGITVEGDSSPLSVRTSWNDVKDNRFKALGRTGYSVKYVSLRSLRNGETLSDGRQNFQNTMPNDAESGADLPKVQH